MVPMATNGNRADQAVQVFAGQEKVWTFIFTVSLILKAGQFQMALTPPSIVYS